MDHARNEKQRIMLKKMKKLITLVYSPTSSTKIEQYFRVSNKKEQIQIYGIQNLHMFTSWGLGTHKREFASVVDIIVL